MSFIIQTTQAQLNFKIEELSLSNFEVELGDNVIDEDLENGPYVHLKCLIINSTNDTLLLKPANSKTKIVFRYKKLNYTLEVTPLPFVDNEELIIPPNGTVNLAFGSHLLLGTKLFENKQGNYIKEMLCILPTLKVVYQDADINICTDEIKNVILR